MPTTVKTITITVTSTTESGEERAINEAIKRIKEGCTSGHDVSDDSRFNFDVSVTEEPAEATS